MTEILSLSSADNCSNRYHNTARKCVAFLIPIYGKEDLVSVNGSGVGLSTAFSFGWEVNNCSLRMNYFYSRYQMFARCNVCILSYYWHLWGTRAILVCVCLLCTMSLYTFIISSCVLVLYRM